MNYSAHYERLIVRARGRRLSVYRERHHVIPRCMGGEHVSSNIVCLTAEEHYVAHQLLVKMYPGNGKLAHAAMTMALRCSGNKAYGWVRRRHADAISKNWTRERRAALSAEHLGKKRSAETRQRISIAMRGNRNPAGKPRTAQHREKLAAGRLGKRASAETRVKIGLASSRRVSSTETRKKISASLIGNTNAKGSSPSAEQRQRTGDRFRGRSLTQAHRAKIAAALLGNRNAVEWRTRRAEAD